MTSTNSAFDIDGMLVVYRRGGRRGLGARVRGARRDPADIGKFYDAGRADPDVGAKTFEAGPARPSADELAELVQPAARSISPRRLPSS